MDFNAFIAGLYEPWFDWGRYQELLTACFNLSDFSKIGLVFIAVSSFLLFLFYKVWDPVKSPKLNYYLTLIIIGVISYIATSTILYSNAQILMFMGSFTGDDGQVSGDYFIFQMSAISFVYSIVLSFIYSLLMRYISVANRHNPF